MSLALGVRVKALEKRVSELESVINGLKQQLAVMNREQQVKRRGPGRPSNAELEMRRLEQESAHA